ncbi:type II toxin-antitoxin system HicA family toxin [Endozoicomonas sp. 4G]|uniref:type II toxin-antitoxin system HicA family toxin n=1 Tax=Endozoicomonas sp. 4G TaxID=2872754 RepID=UPI00211274DB|nr:type II toxin-antitoxin system HicA family toxin [Endozoicomonas sp. 4G]
MKSREIIRMLEDAGWVLHRVKGSHHHFKHSERPGLVTVPHPKHDISKKTLDSIRKQAGMKNPPAG